MSARRQTTKRKPRAKAHAKQAAPAPSRSPVSLFRQSRPGVPVGFYSRTHAMDVGGARTSPGEVMQRRASHRRMKEAEMAAARSSEKVAERDAHEQERMAALLRAQQEAVWLNPVHSDYFGTDEHRALGELIDQILAGKNPFAEAVQVDAVALRRVAGPGPTGTPLTRQDVGFSREWEGWLRGEELALSGVFPTGREIPVRDGLGLGYGDVVALAGDFYATLDELRRKLSPAIRREIQGITPRRPGALQLQCLVGPMRFLQLASCNFDHFTPHNWLRWAEEHLVALEQALAWNLDEALLRNAFGDHFLTDAFASGHMRVPRVLLARSAPLSVLGGFPSRDMHNEENAHGLWVENLAGDVWHAYGDDHLGDNPVHLSLAAAALGRSVRRIYRAWRMDAPEREALRALLPQAKEDVAGLRAQLKADASGERAARLRPDALPDLFGDAGLGLDRVRELLPMPLEVTTRPFEDERLGNYPPQHAPRKAKRKGTPPFEDWFTLT